MSFAEVGLCKTSATTINFYQETTMFTNKTWPNKLRKFAMLHKEMFYDIPQKVSFVLTYKQEIENFLRSYPFP